MRFQQGQPRLSSRRDSLTEKINQEIVNPFYRCKRFYSTLSIVPINQTFFYSLFAQKRVSVLEGGNGEISQVIETPHKRQQQKNTLWGKLPRRGFFRTIQEGRAHTTNVVASGENSVDIFFSRSTVRRSRSPPIAANICFKTRPEGLCVFTSCVSNGIIRWVWMHSARACREHISRDNGGAATATKLSSTKIILDLGTRPITHVVVSPPQGPTHAELSMGKTNKTRANHTNTQKTKKKKKTRPPPKMPESTFIFITRFIHTHKTQQ